MLWLLGKGECSGLMLRVEAQRGGLLLTVLSLYLSYFIRSFLATLSGARVGL